jgi:hypothetical protein
MPKPTRSRSSRPAARPRRPRPTGSRWPRWLALPTDRSRRIALGIVVAAIASVLIARVAHAVITPVVAIYRSGVAIRELEGRLAQEEARRQRLLADRRYLNTPAGVEEEARRQGWVRAGETAIQILRPEAAPPERPRSAPRPASPPRQPGFWERVVAPFLSGLSGGTRRAPAQETK